MRIAVIDLGTNSVRFDIHEIATDRSSRRLYRERLMVKLGQDVFVTGRLNPKAVVRTLEAFRAFRIIADEHRVERIVAVGTSTLRDAKGSQQFIAKIKRETGIDIRVISGRDEARYIAQGVLKNERTVEGKFLLIDIGGGSTEIVLGKGRRIQRMVSLNLGAARLQQTLLKSVPPKHSDDLAKDGVYRFRAYVQFSLFQLREFARLARGAQIIGSSGGIRAICRLSKKGNGSISRTALRELTERMSWMTRRELLQMPRMEANRIDLILSSSILLEELITFFGGDEIHTTDFSLRDGVFEDERRKARIGKDEISADALIDRFDERAPKSEILKGELRLLRSFVKRAGSGLKLTRHTQKLLEIALAVRGLGRMVSDFRQELFASAVARSLDLGDVSEIDHDFIAELCHGYLGGRINEEDLSFSNDKRQLEQFFRALSIIRIVHALSISCSANLKLHSLKSSSREITLRISGKLMRHVAEMRLDQAKELFEKVYRRRLILRT